MDEAEAERLAIRAFDSALEEMVESGEPEALELAAANRRRTLLEMTRGAYDELRSHGDPSPALPQLPPPDTAAAIAELVEAGAGGPCSSARRRAASQWRAGSGSPERWTSIRRFLRTTSCWSPCGDLEISSSAKAFKGEACERYTKALKRAQAAVAAHVLGPAYEQLRELVGRFGARYEQLKAERSALDFEDLQLKAVELLTDSDALRDRYREQFGHLMVDEFQDTNGLQLRLIEQLRGPETRLFLVGDEFQSIYGFRHADVEVYRRQHRRFERGRGAQRGGAAADRQLPRRAGARRDDQRDRPEPARRLRAADRVRRADEPGGGSAVELLLTVDDKKGWEAEETALPRLADDPSSGSKVAEARRLAGRLRELVDDESVDPAEIVVLMRAFTHVAAVERHSRTPASIPTSSAAAASGRSSRSRTCAACSP